MLKKDDFKQDLYFTKSNFIRCCSAVAMVMVWYATPQIPQTNQQIVEEEMLQKLQSLESALDKALE